jgi:hypothetical protein
MRRRGLFSIETYMPDCVVCLSVLTLRAKVFAVGEMVGFLVGFLKRKKKHKHQMISDGSALKIT